MNNKTRPEKNPQRFFIAISLLFISCYGFAQNAAPRLEKMPVALETDYALSALPPQLRPGAAIYLLNPAKGYYLARKGTNGFVCFVARTAWQWGEFRDDMAAPISYDAEGARTIFQVDLDVAAMRASGKFTALQVRNIVLGRIKKGIYKPLGNGISYMLAPVMRAYTGTPPDDKVMTMHMPHYMFYAPYLTNADIGNIPDGQQDGPFVISPESMFLGKHGGPYGFIIVPVGAAERAKIVSENKKLLARLIAYKPYFKVAGDNR